MSEFSSLTSRAKRGLFACNSGLKNVLYQLDNPVAHKTVKEPKIVKPKDASLHTLRIRADVHVSPETLAQPIRAGDHPFDWSLIASTLIRGQSVAVLVNTAITISQNTKLADWVDSLLKPQNIQLESIYITRGHADHFLGLSILTQQWPDVKILAA